MYFNEQYALRQRGHLSDWLSAWLATQSFHNNTGRISHSNTCKCIGIATKCAQCVCVKMWLVANQTRTQAVLRGYLQFLEPCVTLQCHMRLGSFVCVCMCACVLMLKADIKWILAQNNLTFRLTSAACKATRCDASNNKFRPANTSRCGFIICERRREINASMPWRRGPLCGGSMVARCATSLLVCWRKLTATRLLPLSPYAARRGAAQQTVAANLCCRAS